MRIHYLIEVLSLIVYRATIVHALKTFPNSPKSLSKRGSHNRQKGFMLHAKLSVGDDNEIKSFLKEHPFIKDHGSKLLVPAYCLDSNNKVGSEYLAFLQCFGKDRIMRYRKAEVEDIKSCFVAIAILGKSQDAGERSGNHHGMITDHSWENPKIIKDLKCQITAMEFIELQDEMKTFLTDNKYFECNNCGLFSVKGSYSTCKGTNHQQYRSMHNERRFTYDDYLLVGLSFLQYLDEAIVKETKSVIVIEKVKRFAQTGSGFCYNLL